MLSSRMNKSTYGTHLLIFTLLTPHWNFIVNIYIYCQRKLKKVQVARGCQVSWRIADCENWIARGSGDEIKKRLPLVSAK
jgi:hypothetical protein